MVQLRVPVEAGGGRAVGDYSASDAYRWLRSTPCALNSYTLNAIASRSLAHCFSAASVASLRAAMLAHSCWGVGESPSSASKTERLADGLVGAGDDLEVARSAV